MSIQRPASPDGSPAITTASAETLGVDHEPTQTALGQLRAAGSVLLVSCYELGRQPFNIASPWAQLEARGYGVSGLDLAVEKLSEDTAAGAKLIALSVPMHTALRLSMTVASKLREQAPDAHFCFFGLYAALNAKHLLEGPADSVIGGEFEQALLGLAQTLDGGAAPETVATAGLITRNALRDPNALKSGAAGVLRKLPFVVPQRDKLPPLERYATFFGPKEDEVRKVAYVEATRGCLHSCRHCPITPVYQGRFFVVPQDIVLADARQQVAAGAGHITFGDPDFFNGPGHGMAIARALHEENAQLSFDVTIKVEHLLRYPERVKELGKLGCAFIISAIESLSDEVLEKLDKGHTRADIDRAITLCRDAGVALRPTLVAFTPWTTLDDYIEVLDWIIERGLVDAIEPIQLAIRLLVPPGSALLEGTDTSNWLGELVAEDFGYRWTHPDPRMDALHQQVTTIVETGADDDWGDVVLRVREAAYAAADKKAPTATLHNRGFVPRLSESWFCCAEPSGLQQAQLAAQCCNE